MGMMIDKSIFEWDLKHLKYNREEIWNLYIDI